MEIRTLSAVLSFAEKLEGQGAEFYEDLSNQEKFSENRNFFSDFAKGNRKHKQQVKRAYQESITDAFETGGSFNLEPSDYLVSIAMSGGLGQPAIIKKAIELEEKMGKFYLDAGDQSKSLLADISRTFKLIAKKKSERQNKLRYLYQENKGGLDD